MKSYYAQQRQKLMASAWVDKPHRDKWEFIEKRLHRAMTLVELKEYIGYVDRHGKFRPPKAGWYDVPPGVELSEANGDKMPDEDRGKLLTICAASKSGVRIPAEDEAYYQRMYKAFPEEYARVHKGAVKLAEKTVNPLAGEE
jgi:hypothetical protein